MRWFIALIFLLCIEITSSKDGQINVFGRPLESCSFSPKTGYYRSGYCEWDGPRDFGVHSVCAEMTNEFLEYTRSRGNDLSTPNSLSGFPGLKQGDRWCLCAGRWYQAYKAGVAPPVILQSTHKISLNHVTLNELRRNALDDRVMHFEM